MNFLVTLQRTFSDLVSSKCICGLKPTDIQEDQEKLAYIAGRLLFSRLTLQFGWTGDESKAGGRVCVMGVMAG